MDDFSGASPRGAPLQNAPLNEQPRRKRRGCSFSTAFCLLRVLLQQFFRLGDEYCEPDIALPSQPPFVDPGRRRPGLNSRLHPNRHDDRPDAPALAFEIGQHPPSLALLNGLDFELSQFIPSEGAADQQGQDEVVALAFEGRAVRDCQEFLGLLTGQPVPFCRIFGMSVRLAASSWPIMPFRWASVTIFRTAESRTFIVDGDKDSIPAFHSMRSDRERGRLAQDRNRSSRLWRSCAGCEVIGPRRGPVFGVSPAPG